MGSWNQHRQRRNRASDKKKIDAYRQTQSLPPPRDRNAYNNVSTEVLCMCYFVASQQNDSLAFGGSVKVPSTGYLVSMLH